MTPRPGIEPGPHWWEASALTTAPSLLPVGAAGNEAFEQFLDKITHTLNNQWEENDGTTEDVSKDDRNVLRVAAVMHMFYGQLLNRLEGLPASSPPSVVSAETLKRAIALTHYFTEQRKVLDQVLTNIK